MSIVILKLTLQAKYTFQINVRILIYVLNNKYNQENIYFYQVDISLLLHIFSQWDSADGFLHALIKLKHKHHLCHKHVVYGEPATVLTEGNPIPLLSPIKSSTNNMEKNTAMLHHISILHEFSELAKESRYQRNEYLRASGLITQPNMFFCSLWVRGLSFLSTKLC